MSIFEEIIVFFIFSSSILLGFYVWIGDKSNKTNVWFFILSISTAFWVVFANLAFYEKSTTIASYFYKINFAAVSIFLLSSYQLYVENFLNEKNEFIKKIVVILSLTFVYISIATQGIITQIITQEWGNEIKFGYANNYFNLFALFISLYIIVKFIGKYISLPQKERVKTIYFLIGTLLTILFNILFNIVSPMISGTAKYQHFGDYSVFFLIIFTTYAIVKQELFNIKVLLTSILVSSIGLLLLIDTFIFTQSTTLFVFKLITICLYIYFGYILIKTSSKEIQKTEELTTTNKELSQKNHELEAIFKITNQIVTTLDPHEVAKRAVNSVPDQLELIGAIVCAFDPLYKTHRLLSVTDIVESTMFSKAIQNSLSVKITSTQKIAQVPFNENNFAIFDSFGEGFPLLNDDKFNKQVEQELKVHKVINIPLISRGQNLGVVSFLVDKSQFERIQSSPTEYDLMQTFASQLSIGLENARLFDQYIQLTEILEEKNLELNAYAEKEKDILDIMGHELRTPIAIVRNSLSMMKSMIDSKNYNELKMYEYLEIALKSARREIGIIETMLASTKIEGGKIQLIRTKVHPKELVEEAMVGQEENYKKKSLQIITKIPDDIPDIFADRARSQEIVDNILSNAVKYTNTGSINIELSSNKDFVTFKISDTGIGIPKDLLHKLGTKFFRVSQHINDNQSDARLYTVVRPGGTGLGLYVTFNLIKLHGGVVEVESEPNMGSTFKFTFPIYKNQKIESDPSKTKDLLAEYKKRRKGDALSDRI